MALSVGIVGLPNVGKSTLFNALSDKQAEAANYAFCTIDPNVGVVAVPDPRLDQLAAIVNPQKVLPTTMEFVDIAGLVAGAIHRGTISGWQRNERIEPHETRQLMTQHGALRGRRVGSRSSCRAGVRWVARPPVCNGGPDGRRNDFSYFL